MLLGLFKILHSGCAAYSSTVATYTEDATVHIEVTAAYIEAATA